MPRADLEFQSRVDSGNVGVDRVLPKFDRVHAAGAGSIAEGHLTEYVQREIERRSPESNGGSVEDMFVEERQHLADNYWDDVLDPRKTWI